MSAHSLVISKLDGGRDDVRILRLEGPLTLGSHSQFQTAVREESRTSLLVDLTAVPYVDSAGLGSLVGALVTLQRANKRLALVGANQRVRALIQMSNLSGIFRTFPTTAEAEAGLVSA